MQVNIDHETIIVPVTMTRMMRRAAKEQSKKLAGCPRPSDGSISYFVFRAMLRLFKEHGLDLEKLDPIYKHETNRLTGRPLNSKKELYITSKR
jgi:hypothetical protein